MVFKHSTSNSKGKPFGEWTPGIGKNEKDSEGNVKSYNLL